MRNCLVVFSVCCIHLSVRGLKLAHPGVEIVQGTSSHCTSSNGNQNFSAAKEVHGRNKRYLLFEKGAAVSVTTAVVKTIVPGIPRGFNIICEESLYYDLPASLVPPMKDLMKPIPKTELPSKQPGIRGKNWLQRHKIRNHDNFEKYYNIENYDFPNYEYSYVHQNYDPYQKRRKIRSAEDAHDLLDIEAIFFQQIESFAKRLGFNGRYCIMRTICESKYMLFAEGQSLFHDVIRKILEFSLPTIKENRKYLMAWNSKSLMDCANLYGPHCNLMVIWHAIYDSKNTNGSGYTQLFGQYFVCEG